jgi:hypothetical protein
VTLSSWQGTEYRESLAEWLESWMAFHRVPCATSPRASAPSGFTDKIQDVLTLIKNYLLWVVREGVGAGGRNKPSLVCTYE